MQYTTALGIHIFETVVIALSSIHPTKIYVRKMVSNGPIIGLFLGTGFSFTSSKGGYPTTDEDLASELLEGLTQFMLLFPYMVPGAVSSQTPVYAFGESYGGAYVVSLAHVYLQQRYKIASVS